MQHLTLILAPAVRFEPCVGFHADDAGDAICTDCGWSLDDHTLAA